MLATGCAASTASQAPGAAANEREAKARAAQVERLLQSGRTLAWQYRPRDAELPLRQAIALGWGHGEPWTQYRARAFSELARALLAQGRAADARAAVDEALALLEPGVRGDDQQSA